MPKRDSMLKLSCNDSVTTFRFDAKMTLSVTVKNVLSGGVYAAAAEAC